METLDSHTFFLFAGDQADADGADKGEAEGE
jgi:hypothetical protein